MTIYYDGACRLCRRQMGDFADSDTKKRLIFKDITNSSFVAEREGFDVGALQAKIHIKDREGRVATGAEAIIWIWWAVGKKKRAILMRLPVFNFFAKIGYKIIARLRYFLSKWAGDKMCRGKCGWKKY